MTDTPENNGTENSPQPVPPVTTAAPATPPVEEASYNQPHTAANTTMKKLVPSADTSHEATDEDRVRGYINLFPGNTKEFKLRMDQLVGRWLTFSSTKELYDKDRIEKSRYVFVKNEWEEFIQKNYPGKSIEQMVDLAATVYRYQSEILDSIAVRSKVMHEEDISNVSDRGSNVITGDIVGKKPSRNVQGFKLSELIRRTGIRAESGDYQYDLLCRSSYLSLTFVRPNKLELGDLINDIQRTVKGYVRTIGGNSLAIASIAGMEVVWNFLEKRIVNCSVKDLTSFSELGRLIRTSDFAAICTALLKATNNEGVNLNLHCPNLGDCDWSEVRVVDPTELLRVRHHISSDEDMAIYANIFNGLVKYTFNETMEMINKSTYGLESNKIYNEDKSIYFEVAPSSISEAIETFQYYTGRVNPDIQNIRSKVTDPVEYENQLATLLLNLGATEYINWIKTYVVLPDPGSEDQPLVIRRSESDAAEFNAGVMDVILDSKFLNKAFSNFVLNKAPFMAHTFTGVMNCHCPKCKKSSAEFSNLGYTPIDAFLTFFTQAHLRQLVQATETAKATEEALSN